VKIRHPFYKTEFDDSTEQAAIYHLPVMDKDEIVFKCIDPKCQCELRARHAPSVMGIDFEFYYNGRLH
jgi:hypothetical protein